LTKLNKEPFKRTKHPNESERLNENTPWIKKILESNSSKDQTNSKK
jgi:hypothetical protein